MVLVVIIAVRLSSGSRLWGGCKGRWNKKGKSRSSIEEGINGSKVVRVHALRANWETGGKFPIIFDLGLR